MEGSRKIVFDEKVVDVYCRDSTGAQNGEFGAGSSADEVEEERGLSRFQLVSTVGGLHWLDFFAADSSLAFRSYRFHSSAPENCMVIKVENKVVKLITHDGGGTITIRFPDGDAANATAAKFFQHGFLLVRTQFQRLTLQVRLKFALP